MDGKALTLQITTRTTLRPGGSDSRRPQIDLKDPNPPPGSFCSFYRMCDVASRYDSD